MASVEHEELPMSWSVYRESLLRRVWRRFWVASALLGLQILLGACGVAPLPLVVTVVGNLALLGWVFCAVCFWLPAFRPEPASADEIQALRRALAADGVPERLRRSLRGDLDRGLTAPAARFYSRRLDQIQAESERLAASAALRQELIPPKRPETKGETP